MSSPARYLQLGIHLEYLRGIASSFGSRPAGIDQFGYLEQNEPIVRYSARNVATVIASLLSLLDELKLTRALEVAAEFRPMLAEVEEFVAGNADPASVFLNDHFSDKLVRIADDVTKAVREEVAN